jgi:hypothetical protein
MLRQFFCGDAVGVGTLRFGCVGGFESWWRAYFLPVCARRHGSESTLPGLARSAGTFLSPVGRTSPPICV